MSGGLAISRVEIQPPLFSLSQEPSALRATIVNSSPVVVPPSRENSVPGPARKLALVVAVDFTGASVGAGVGVAVGTRIRVLVVGCGVAVTAGVGVEGVTEGARVAVMIAVAVITRVAAATGVVTATVAVITAGFVNDAMRASVAIVRFVGAFSTKKLAIHCPLSSKYQFLLASSATILTCWPALIWPTCGNETSGPLRKLAVTGTVLPMAAVGTLIAVMVGLTVGVIVAPTLEVTAAVGVIGAVMVGVIVAVAVGVKVAVAAAGALAVGDAVGVMGVVAVTLAVSVAGVATVRVANVGISGLSGVTLTTAVCRSPNVTEMGTVTLG